MRWPVNVGVYFINNKTILENMSSGRLDKVTVIQSSVSLGDPHICTDSVNRLSIINNVFEALIKTDNNGKYQPSLAESWTVEENASKWTFNLRRGVIFHNGETLKASDVDATLRRVIDPSIGGAFGTQGVYGSYLGKAEITAIDDFTVKIVTEEPMADLLDLLIAMPICPESELHKLPGEYCGSGPYKIAEQNRSKTILRAHDTYWGESPRYNEIHWVAIRNQDDRVDALLSGKADIITGLGLKGKERIQQEVNVTVYEQDGGLCIIFMCNAQKGPCKDRRVRQALNYALDMDEIIRVIKKGAATPLNGYLTPHHFGYNPETPAYSYDPGKARSLLAEAGYEGGLKLVIDIPSVMPNEAPQLTALMAEYYSKIGIQVQIIEHNDRAAYAEMVREKKINDACCFDSSPRSTYRVLREKIQSTLQGPWWQGYTNNDVNSLILKAQRTADDNERKVIYQQIYSIIRDDAPWIFMYRPNNYWGVKSTLKGWKPRSDGMLLFS